MQDQQFAEHSLEYITNAGAEYYFHELKDVMEEKENGKFLVLEVKTKKYFVDPDLLVALEKAEKEFPNTLFFIVQIGTLQEPLHVEPA